MESKKEKHVRNIFDLIPVTGYSSLAHTHTGFLPQASAPLGTRPLIRRCIVFCVLSTPTSHPLHTSFLDKLTCSCTDNTSLSNNQSQSSNSVIMEPQNLQTLHATVNDYNTEHKVIVFEDVFTHDCDGHYCLSTLFWKKMNLHYNLTQEFAFWLLSAPSVHRDPSLFREKCGLLLLFCAASISSKFTSLSKMHGTMTSWKRKNWA